MATDASNPVTEYLSAELEAAPEIKPVSCAYPFFIVAYWSNGEYWKVFADRMFPNPSHPILQTEIRELSRKGWQHITICRLPRGGPWEAK